MLENIRNVIARLPMDRLRVRPKLGGHITSRSRHVSHDLVAMANSRYVATAH